MINIGQIKSEALDEFQSGIVMSSFDDEDDFEFNYLQGLKNRKEAQDSYEEVMYGRNEKTFV